MTYLFLILIVPFGLSKQRIPDFKPYVFSDLKNKTAEQAFCSNSKNFQLKLACDEIKKSDEKLNWIIPDVEITSKTSFKIRSRTGFVNVERGSMMTEFIINRKKINLADHTTILSLRDAIVQTLPKVAHFSFWMSKAYAQSQPNQGLTYDQVAMAISLLLKSNQNEEICSAAINLARVCVDFPKESVGSRSLTGIIEKINKRMMTLNPMSTAQEKLAMRMTKLERVLFDGAHSLFKSELLMLSQGLNGAFVVSDQLKACPSVEKEEGKTAKDDVGSCQKALGDALIQLEKYPNEILPKVHGTDRELEETLRAKETLWRQDPKPAPAGSW